MPPVKPLHIGIDGNEANVIKRVGSNRYAFGILQALSQLESPHKFTVYLKTPPVPDLPSANPHFNYKVITPSKMWTQIRLPISLYLDSHRPDVFYTPGHYAPRFSPVPVAITILDLAFLHYPNLFLKYQRGTTQLTQWTNYSVAHAVHIFCISRSTQTDVVKTYHLPPSKTSIAYPGLNQDLIPLAPAHINAVLNRYHLIAPYLIHVGTLQPRKNLNRLIAAVDALPFKSSPKLVLVGGKGWLHASFDTKIRSVKHPERFFKLGFVPDSDLPALYAGALASINVGIQEGFGLPVAEALASGTVAIIADHASLPEVAGAAGIKVDPYSVSSIRQGIMVASKESQEKRQERIVEGQKHIRQFSYQTSALHIVKTLEMLVPGNQ